MSKIKILDELTIQKIAAGEVIENPASIVKELVENSIDAGAKNITIEIVKGGKKSIRITDDGHGMSKEDLEIAFRRHSTSKLSEIEDIYNIMSLGFRGEALASICSVTKMEVLTKTADAMAGNHAIVEDGKIKNIESVGTPKGTTMIIKDIFYNLPVRKKFLKSDTREGNFISNIINRLALGNPNISFKFIRDNQTVLQTSRTNDLKNTIYTVLGKEFASNLIDMQYEDDYIKVTGYIGNNNIYRGNRARQFQYINGRYIKSYAINNAIENRFKTLIPINRYPCYVINIDIDPGEIDINIHPTKQAVKFTDPNRVIGSISNLVSRKLDESLTIPKMEFDREDKEKKEKKEEEKPDKIFDIQHNTDNTKGISIKDFTADKYKSDGSNIIDGKNRFSKKTKDNNREDRLDKPYNPDYHKKEKTNKTIPIEEVDISDFLDEINFSKTDKQIEEKENIDIDFKEQKIDDALLDVQPIGRIFNTYIIAESKDKETVYFVDQHAAHERINYERYKREFENENISIQQLMFPEIIEFTSDEMIKFNHNKDIFNKLGFDIEDFGPNSIALRGVPMLFGNPETKDLFLDIFDNLESGIESNYDMKLDKIMKIACVHSIKSGDKINDKEIMALFKQLIDCDTPYTCPHGRPTIIEMSKSEMEKEFLRIQ